jgi:hypothetical protein
MEESILISIKKMLGIDESYTAFDLDVMVHINSVLMILTQLGVGPSEGFAIEDDSTTWGDFMDDGNTRLNSVKTYMYLKVKLLFDPPTSSATIDSFNRLISELEFRLNVAADNT